MAITKYAVTTLIFTMRRYASTVLTMAVCLTSIRGQYCIKKTGQIKLGFGMAASFHYYTVSLGNLVPPKYQK